jgi:hypothetical protein
MASGDGRGFDPLSRKGVSPLQTKGRPATTWRCCSLVAIAVRQGVWPTLVLQTTFVDEVGINHEALLQRHRPGFGVRPLGRRASVRFRGARNRDAECARNNTCCAGQPFERSCIKKRGVKVDGLRFGVSQRVSCASAPVSLASSSLLLTAICLGMARFDLA